MRRLVAGARVARLATVGACARPHLVPIVFVVDGDQLVTGVDAKPKSGRRLQRFANVEANPAVSVLVDEYDDDWSRLWWVRLDGEALEKPSVPAQWLTLLAGRYPQYRDQPPRGPFLLIQITRWTGWAALA
ncbi:MAG: TIGR03668 family PPOX class F420-dependent oxidoreductase [Egibacteraceae bacterium]